MNEKQFIQLIRIVIRTYGFDDQEENAVRYALKEWRRLQ